MPNFRVILVILCMMLVASLLMLLFSHFFNVDSYYDLFFEANTLAILIYVYVVSRDFLKQNKMLKVGVQLLLFNGAYDVLTEVAYFDALTDIYELTDAIIEDGLLQLSFLLIAFGITEILQQFRELSTIDELTGLFNRKKLRDISLDEFDLVYFDLDGLKEINDSKGHAHGDMAIVRFSHVLKNCCLDKEVVARIGGDEFVAFTLPKRGEEFVETTMAMLHGEEISFAYGIETGCKDTLEEALAKSDAAMYQMKKRERLDKETP